jgi:hypothetical protein
MILPNNENAFIPSAKLYDYLLSETHSAGQGKAKFFREFGFDESNTASLAAGLLAIAQAEQVAQSTPSPHGVKYVIDGLLLTPSGETVRVRTIWIIEIGEDAPRFVTAYPRSI